MDQRDLGKFITELSFIIWGITAWLVLSAGIVAVGGIREFVLIRTLEFGQEAAMPISGFLVVLLSYLMLWHFMCCIMPPRNRIAYPILGAIWAVLIYGFEYLLNVILLGHPSSEICQIYCLSAMNVPFPMLLLVVIGPTLIAYLKGQFKSAKLPDGEVV